VFYPYPHRSFLLSTPFDCFVSCHALADTRLFSLCYVCFCHFLVCAGAPSRELIPIPRCGHVPHEELPEVFVHHFDRFVTKRVDLGVSHREEEKKEEKDADSAEDTDRFSGYEAEVDDVNGKHMGVALSLSLSQHSEVSVGEHKSLLD